MKIRVHIYSKAVKTERGGDFQIVAQSVFVSNGHLYHGETHFAEGSPDGYWTLSRVWAKGKALLEEKYEDGTYMYHSVTIRRPNNRRIVLTR